jgi:hypothetical protein
MSKKKTIQTLSEALVTETNNVAKALKALNDAGLNATALRESYAEMEGERDLYRVAFSIAAGRLSAHTPNEESQAILELLIQEAIEEISVKSER